MFLLRMGETTENYSTCMSVQIYILMCRMIIQGCKKIVLSVKYYPPEVESNSGGYSLWRSIDRILE